MHEPKTPFGQELRRIREQFGVSQNELALRSGLDSATVNKLEAGVNHPLRPTITALVEGFEWGATAPDRRIHLAAASAALLLAAGYCPDPTAHHETGVAHDR